MQVENILLKEMRNLKVIIVGAGAIGMMQARELALKGIEVVLLDKSACGTEASWAGGGIVSPLYPWRYSEPVTALASWSQSYYCLLYTSPSPRDKRQSRMPSSA